MRDWVEHAQKCEQNKKAKPSQNLRCAYLKTTNNLIESLENTSTCTIKVAQKAKTRDNIGTIRGVLYNYVHKNKSKKVPGYIKNL